MDLLLAQGAGIGNAAGALGVGTCIGGLGFGGQHIGLRLQYFSLDRIGRKHGQHLPLAHTVAHIDPHFSQPQAGVLRSDRYVLPGSDVAAGLQVQGHPACFRLDRLHGESRTHGCAAHGCGAGMRPARQGHATRRSSDDACSGKNVESGFIHDPLDLMTDEEGAAGADATVQTDLAATDRPASRSARTASPARMSA